MVGDKKDVDAQEAEVYDGHRDPVDVLKTSEEVMRGEMIAEATRPWRAAESLKLLRNQLNRAWPGRDTSHDGMIGDAAHQSRTSDHNPWVTDGVTGVVTAIDVTHDPKSGCDANSIVAALHASRDARIKYLIWNKRIANSSSIRGVPAWTWRTYSGSNPHTRHFHLSVLPDKPLYDRQLDWTIMQIAESTTNARVGSLVDPDGALLAALQAMGFPTNSEEPALPQLHALQEMLARLRSNHADG